MKVKSTQRIEEGAENWAVCSPVGYFDDDGEEPCMYCGTTVFFRPETSVLSKKMCFDCFKKRIASGEISRKSLEAIFTVETRKELSEKLGREVSVGEMIDMLLEHVL